MLAQITISLLLDAIVSSYETIWNNNSVDGTNYQLKNIALRQKIGIEVLSMGKKWWTDGAVISQRPQSLVALVAQISTT